MRIKQLLTTLLLTIFLIFNTNAQYHFTTAVPNSNGITLDVSLKTTGIVVPNTCINGYNYNISFNYDIRFFKNGTEIEKNAYTLQGNFICGDKKTFFNLPKIGGIGSGETVGNIWRGVSDCSTITIEELGCDKIEFEIQFDGFPNTSFPNSSIIVDATTGLPVELISFDASRDGTFVDLSWVTGSETNNDYFELERSFDGLNWDLVTIVKGQGNTNERTEYSRTDRHHNLNDIVYYKLSQTDFDGKVEVFDIKSINMGKRKILKILNTLGQEVDINYDGLKFVIYDDGETVTLR